MSAQMGNLKKERKIYFSIIGGLIMPNSLERVFLVKTLTSTSNKNLTRALQYQNLTLNIIVFSYLLGCIGCPDWNRCCARDVFGSCVECPSWNKCCYKTGDPVCVAKNHGCDHIRKVASGNLEDARVS